MCIIIQGDQKVQINQLTRCNNFSSLLLDVLCTAQYVSGVLTHIIRSSTNAVASSGFTVGAWWQQCCWSWSGPLTFKNRASCIQDGRTATLQMLHFIYFFSPNISTEYFKHAAHSPFFSSKYRLFHNATIFGSCIIHSLHTGCSKI